ncbi:MAG: hypothetical protein ACPG1C_02495 [Alphaproteobacteria bacterium]
MNRALKILSGLFVVWLCVEIADGVITQWRAVQTGREICGRFLHGYDPWADTKEHPFHVYGIYEDGQWTRFRQTEDDLYASCRFQFKWRMYLDNLFYGVLHIWLSKPSDNGEVVTVFTGAHVHYHFYLNRFVVSGVVMRNRGPFDHFKKGVVMWEETYERKGASSANGAGR